MSQGEFYFPEWVGVRFTVYFNFRNLKLNFLFHFWSFHVIQLCFVLLYFCWRINLQNYCSFWHDFDSRHCGQIQLLSQWWRQKTPRFRDLDCGHGPFLKTVKVYQLFMLGKLRVLVRMHSIFGVCNLFTNWRIYYVWILH